MRLRWWLVRQIPLVVLFLIVGEAHVWAAQPLGDCPAGASPQFGTQFASLRETLGERLGAPLGCAVTNASGDTIQPTTTGLAIYRTSGVALFASGDDHWALTADGLETWVANWHSGFDRPVSRPAPTVEARTPDSELASVQTYRLVSAGPDDRANATVEDDRGERYVLQAGFGCEALPSEVGGVVFIRWDGAVADQNSVLMLIDRQESCAVRGFDRAASSS